MRSLLQVLQVPSSLRTSSHFYTHDRLVSAGCRGKSAHRPFGAKRARGEREGSGAKESGTHLAANSACNAALFGAFTLLLDLGGVGYVGRGEGTGGLCGSLWGRDSGVWLALCLCDHGGGWSRMSFVKKILGDITSTGTRERQRRRGRGRGWSGRCKRRRRGRRGRMGEDEGTRDARGEGAKRRERGVGSGTGTGERERESAREG
jgi:hypothetical protein